MTTDRRDEDPDASVSPDSDPPAESDSAGLVIAGRVLGEKDSAVSETVVSIISGPARHADLAAVTNEEGAFELSVATPGTYTLAVHDSHARSAQVDVLVSATSKTYIEIRLHR